MRTLLSSLILTLITSPKPHLQRPWHWGLGPQLINFERHTHSVHNTHDKNSHPTKKRGELLQLDKDYLQKKAIANITLNGEILDVFPQEQEQGKHQSIGSPRQNKKARKRN